MTDLLAIDQPQFNGGLNTFATDDTLSANQLSELQNMTLNPRYNALEQIGGTSWVLSNNAVQDNTDAQIVSMFRFYLSNGNVYNMLHIKWVAAGVLPPYVIVYVYDSDWINVHSIRPAGDTLDAPITDWAVYQNNVYWVCGNDTIYSWDGNLADGVGSQQVAPVSFEPKYIEMYNGRAYYAGDNTQPSRLIASRPGTPLSFEAPFVEPLYDINNSDGDSITSLAVLGGNLIVFKENSFYIVEGSLPRRITQHPSVGVGCMSNDTVKKTPVGLIFLSKKGVYAYNGSSLSLISGNITSDIRFILGRSEKRFSAAYHTSHYYLFYKPSDKDYINKGWSFDLLGLEYGDQVIPISSINNLRYGGGVVYTGAEENDEWFSFLDFEKNAVVKMLDTNLRTFYVDASTTIAIDPYLTTRWLDMGNRTITKELRVVYIYTHQYVNGGRIQIQVDLDGVDGVTTHNLPAVAGVSVWGTGLWGTATWDSARSYRYRIDLPTGIFCNRCRIKFYAEATTAFINIDRLRLHYLALREY